MLYAFWAFLRVGKAFVEIPFQFFSENLQLDMACNFVNELSTTIGGESYFSWQTVFSEAECKSLCSQTGQCDRVSYSVFQLEKKCLLYREEDFQTLTEVYSTSWTKECPDGKLHMLI